MKYTLCITIFLFSAIPRIATGQWNYLSTGESRHLYSLELFGPDTVYAFGNNGAFISSFNGGQSWTINSVPNATDIYYSAFIDKYTGVILDNSGNIKYTTDGGQSWLAVGPLPSTQFLTDLEMTSDSTIILTGSFGPPGTSNLFISNDWGNSWILDSVPASFFGPSSGLEVLNDSTWILGMFDFSVYKTTDKGLNWQNVFMGNVGSELQYLNASDDSTIYGIGCLLNCDYCFLRSVDQGSTWSGYGPMGTSLFFLKDGSGTIISGCIPFGGQALIYSSDSGYTNYLSHSVSGDTLLNNIQYANKFVGFVCGWYGTVLKTTNGGATAINETPSLIADIHPNPFSDHLELSYNSNEILTFKLYDESSRVLVNHSFSSDLLLNTSSFSRGIYFYSISNSHGSRSHGKLIKVE